MTTKQSKSKMPSSVTCVLAFWPSCSRAAGSLFWVGFTIPVHPDGCCCVCRLEPCQGAHRRQWTFTHPRFSTCSPWWLHRPIHWSSAVLLLLAVPSRQHDHLHIIMRSNPGFCFCGCDTSASPQLRHTHHRCRLSCTIGHPRLNCLTDFSTVAVLV